MDMDRFRAALDLVLDLHKDQTWPGSRTPYVSHAIEVACRVAALGGKEDTIIAALLHDSARDRDEAATLQRIRAGYGERVAELLGTCWGQHFLPHSGWIAWMPEGAPDNPELHLLLGCDALCCFRNILLDWQTLAHLWDEPPKGDLCDRLWLQQQAHLPEAQQLVRERWIPSSVEHPTPQGVRLELMNFYQDWMEIPLRISEKALSFPSLALMYQEGAWNRWVDSQELVSLLASWGLGGLAKELRILLGRLNGMPGMARASFLRQSGRDPGLLGPEVVASCLRKLTLLELKLVLGNRHSRLVRSFREHVPMSILDVLSVGASRSAGSTLAEPILLHCLGEVASEGRVIGFPPLGRVGGEVAEGLYKSFPPTDRFGMALSLIFESHAGECWPITTIPYVFHSLEVCSLMLTSGWGEDTAILAMLHDLPRTENSLHRVQTTLGPDSMDELKEFWRLEGLSHRVPHPDQGTLDIELAPASLAALTLMDATSLLRFVAEDFQAMGEANTSHQDNSRSELANRLLFFKGFLHGRPLRVIAETVLVESRFGQVVNEWRLAVKAMKAKPDHDFMTIDARLGEGAEEIMVLLARQEIPRPVLVGLACALESMEDWNLRWLLDQVGLVNAGAAFQDPTWDQIWSVVNSKLGASLRDTLESQRQMIPPEDVASIRRGQKAILTAVGRMISG